MIVKQKQLGFFQLLLEMRGSIVPAIMPKVVFFTCVAVFACLALSLNLFGKNTSELLRLEFGPFTALGVAISLFLGFHNNASYDRWWEARKLWGKQIIVTRDLARFLAGVMDVDDGTVYDPLDKNNEFKSSRTAVTKVPSTDTSVSDNDVSADLETNRVSTNWNGIIQSMNVSPKHTDPKAYKYASWQAHCIFLSVAHTHAFRYQMRNSCKMDGRITALHDRNRFLNPAEEKHLLSCKNNANTILMFASKILGKAHRAEKIDTYSMIHVQKIIDSMCFMQTAAERISNTSLPLAYSLLVHRTSVLYVLLVPFAIAPTIGWWTPLFTAIVAYTFFGLDELAKEIQEPFRDRPMCLALSAMCRTIEIDALEILGEETPPFLTAKGNVLM